MGRVGRELRALLYLLGGSWERGELREWRGERRGEMQKGEEKERERGGEGKGGR